MLKTSLLLLVSFVFISQINAQENLNRKKISASRTSTAPTIDGVLDDDAWRNAEIINNFVMMRPDNGKLEPDTHKTVVKLVYDDDAIYIGATMYDDNPSSIPMEFTSRDNFGQSDFFLVTINPNDDGQNPFEFVVMSTGTQADAKISNGSEDHNWSAVWKSSARLTDKGWVAEMKIPYSAIRFSNQPVQSWGFNFHRRVQNLNAQFTWNHIDNTKGTWTQYDGLIENFKDIKPPTRLSFYPYASITSDNFGDPKTDYNVGLDIKYGITENFTLDATLIPDFGQTAFDNVTLNLGPFEQQYSEQRQFFTEGTELFGKGNLFYSRRIGDSPSLDYGTLEDSLLNESLFINNKKITEEIDAYPNKVQMLNAIKISGRTKSGLGIGIFNAFTEKTSATIKKTTINNSSGSEVTSTETYNTTVEPFTNYSVLVLDQQFNQNSAITLINTNVTRKGDFRDGNVTGLLYHVATKDSKYFVDGAVLMSNVGANGAKTTGYSFDTSIGKGFGNWQGEVGFNFDDSKYDINDLGFQSYNNVQSYYGNLSYRILKPTKNFNTININSWFQINHLYKPNTYIGNNVGLHIFSSTKKRFSLGGGFNANIGKQYDYYEPREAIEDGIFFIRPSKLRVNHWGSSDFRKQFSYNYSFFRTWYQNNPKSSYGFKVTPRYRFNNQFSLNYSFKYNKTKGDQGHVKTIKAEDIIEDITLAPFLGDIIFGQRNRKTYNNSISGKYSFSLKSSLSLTFRHNWQAVKYTGEYFDLHTSGNLITQNTYAGRSDINFNSWNLDLNYIWEFAPGSQLIAFYRNTISNSDTNANLNFIENIENLFQQDKQHIFSLRFVYYIDYNSLKKKS